MFWGFFLLFFPTHVIVPQSATYSEMGKEILRFGRKPCDEFKNKQLNLLFQSIYVLNKGFLGFCQN